MRTYIFLLSLLAASCATKPPVAKPITGRLPDVLVTPKISDTSDRVAAASQDADTQSAVTASKVEAVKKESARLRNSLDTAVNEADRLRKQKTASEKELNDLWTTLNNASQRNLFLEQEIKDAEASLIKEKELRILASKAISDLKLEARAKDSEVDLLRNNLVISKTTTEDLAAANSSLQSASDEFKTKYDQAVGAARTWRKILIGVACLAALSIAANILQFKSII